MNPIFLGFTIIAVCWTGYKLSNWLFNKTKESDANADADEEFLKVIKAQNERDTALKINAVRTQLSAQRAETLLAEAKQLHQPDTIKPAYEINQTNSIPISNRYDLED